jgi:class 3 adenylate cyclase
VQNAQRRGLNAPLAAAQVLAGLRAEQGATEEALALLRKSIACWLPAAPAGGEDADADVDEAADGALSEPPSFEFRVVTAKLLIDLDDSTETAVRVLEVRGSRLMNALLQALPPTLSQLP